MQEQGFGHEIHAKAGALTADLPGGLSATVELAGRMGAIVHISGADPETIALLPHQTSIVYVQRALSRFKLPYQITYQPADAKRPGSLYWAPAYRAEGILAVGACSVRVALLDLDGNGKFDFEDSKRGTILGVDIDGDGRFWGAGAWRKTSEIIELCGVPFDVKAIKGDGTLIVFRKSEIRPAAIGKRVPDFTVTDMKGRVIRSSEFRGKVTLIDFWASCCAPCVESLPTIEQMFAGRKNVSLLEWNVDDADFREKAERIVAMKNLSSTQIIRGLGDQDYVWRMLGSIEGAELTPPLYLVIDSNGVITHSSRVFEQVRAAVEQEAAKIGSFPAGSQPR